MAYAVACQLFPPFLICSYYQVNHGALQADYLHMMMVLVQLKLALVAEYSCVLVSLTTYQLDLQVLFRVIQPYLEYKAVLGANTFIL